MSRIREDVINESLSAKDRHGLVRDIHGAVISCEMKISEALEFLKIFKTEKNYIVWSEIIGILTHIRFIYSDDSDMSKKINKFILDFTKEIYTHIGFSEKKVENHTDVLLRSIILSVRISSSDKNALEKAVSISKQKSISPNIRGVVYSAVVLSGDKSFYNKLFTSYDNASMHEEKNRIARALLSTKNKSDFKFALKWILSGKVRSQDVPMYLSQALYNRHNKDLALEFIFEKWSYLISKYSGDKYTRSRIIGALDGFSNKEHMTSIAKFFKNNEHKGAERTLLQSLESVESNIYFKKFHKKDLEKYL